MAVSEMLEVSSGGILIMETIGENMLRDFFDVIKDDPRIGPSHVCLYTSMLAHCMKSGGHNPFSVSRPTMMQAAKISSRYTYNRVINDLKNFGYIRYIPAQNIHASSYVFLRRFNSRFS